jgi:hydrogenase/urease accessory protein HupE
VGGDLQTDAVVVASEREVHVGTLEETGFFAMVRMGIEHILTGWDHLAFLLGLVVVGGRWKSILAAITAFTIAHSITLGLAAFAIVRGSPLFVEPMIALSVVYGRGKLRRRSRAAGESRSPSA